MRHLQMCQSSAPMQPLNLVSTVFRESNDDAPNRAPGNRLYVSPRGLKPAARILAELEKHRTSAGAGASPLTHGIRAGILSRPLISLRSQRDNPQVDSTAD